MVHVSGGSTLPLQENHQHKAYSNWPQNWRNKNSWRVDLHFNLLAWQLVEVISPEFNSPASPQYLPLLLLFKLVRPPRKSRFTHPCKLFTLISTPLASTLLPRLLESSHKWPPPQHLERHTYLALNIVPYGHLLLIGEAQVKHHHVVFNRQAVANADKLQLHLVAFGDTVHQHLRLWAHRQHPTLQPANGKYCTRANYLLSLRSITTRSSTARQLICCCNRMVSILRLSLVSGAYFLATN